MNMSSTRRATAAAPSTGSRVLSPDAGRASGSATIRRPRSTFGWMAHYVGDILQPYHTNYAAINLDDSHLSLRESGRCPDPEPRCIARTGSPTTGRPRRSYRRACHLDRGGGLLAQVLPGALSASSRSMRPCSLLGSWRSPATCSSGPRPILPTCSTRSTRESGTAAPVDSASSAERPLTCTRPRTATQTVSVTVKGLAGQPLQGVRVDIAFPKRDGRDDPVRRYTTAERHRDRVGEFGASPFGFRRDVEVTVKTGDVVKTASTWFMTSGSSPRARPASSHRSTTGPSIRVRRSASGRWPAIRPDVACRS